jgi:hypothetical protein
MDEKSASFIYTGVTRRLLWPGTEYQPGAKLEINGI